MTDGSDLAADLLAELIARLDAACAKSVTIDEVFDRLELAEAERNTPISVVAMAFLYKTGEPRKDNPRFFGPSFQMTDGNRYPPVLADIAPETYALWQDVGANVASPIARARLNDLCFEGGKGHRGNLGRQAVEAYLEIAALPLPGSDGIADVRAGLARVRALQRASVLARRIGDQELASRVSEATVAAAWASIRSERREPGVAFGLLRALANQRAKAPELPELLVQARTAYKDDVRHSDQIIALQLRCTRAGDVDARVQLQQDRVNGWITEANRSHGLARMRDLETAAKLARDYGLTDLLGEILTKMQTADPSDLGLTRMSVPIVIPVDMMEEYFSQFTDAPSWQDAFTALISSYPPSGDAAGNVERAEALHEETPLIYLISRMRVGGDGLPRFTVTSDKDRDEWWLAEQEIILIQLQAPHVAEVFRRIWTKWGPITKEDLAAYLGAQSHVTAAMAVSLARAFVRHFTGDPEGAAYTAMPKVEALVRAIVLASGTPIYRTQREKIPGQYPGLGALLPELRKLGLDQSWFRFLHTYFASIAGANERNELLHGFVDQVTETASALILLAATYLAVAVRLTATDAGDASSDANEPPNQEE